MSNTASYPDFKGTLPEPGTREIGLSALDLLDVCYTAREIVDTVMASEGSYEEDKVELKGISINPSLVPTSFHSYARGATFDKISVSYDRHADKTSNVRITAHDSSQGDRQVTFSEQPDNPQIVIDDSHATLFTMLNRSFPEQANRGEITRWIAAQALSDKDEAYDFVNAHSYDGIAIAAEILSMKAAVQFATKVKRVELSNGVTLECGYTEQSDPTKMSLYPDVRCYKLGVSALHEAGYYFGHRFPWVKRTTVIEFCPEARITRPLRIETDPTSARIKIQTDDEVAPCAIQQLADLSAAEAETKVQEILKNQLALVKPIRL